MNEKKKARLRRAAKTRTNIRDKGAVRLCVHRTPRHIYAQVIAANGATVLATASTVEADLRSEITGNVSASGGGNLVGATVEVFSGVTLIKTGLTDASGNYSISGLAVGTYNVEALFTGYQDATQSATVTAGTTTSGVNFSLEGNPGTVSGQISSDCNSDCICGAIVEALSGETLIGFTVTDNTE